mmetsp:Transcript_70638/g.112245  ORF Transcript_70638/g.112245 Transcript_70638/m.112245 type:complete len:111 (-) Transcript_70638:142-474(-)
MAKQSVLWLLILALLLVIPCQSYYEYEADESEEKSVKIKHHKKKGVNIGLGRIREANNIEGDQALSEFTLAAGSQINLRLWQFIVWQIGFVIVGMLFCGCSILIFSRCCK